MKATQEQMVLTHLKKHKSIEPLTALKLYGCFRLAEIVRRIKAKGVTVKTVLTESKSKFGVKRYAKYVINK